VHNSSQLRPSRRMDTLLSRRSSRLGADGHGWVPLRVFFQSPTILSHDNGLVVETETLVSTGQIARSDIFWNSPVYFCSLYWRPFQSIPPPANARHPAAKLGMPESTRVLVGTNDQNIYHAIRHPDRSPGLVLTVFRSPRVMAQLVKYCIAFASEHDAELGSTTWGFLEIRSQDTSRSVGMSSRHVSRSARLERSNVNLMPSE